MRDAELYTLSGLYSGVVRAHYCKAMASGWVTKLDASDHTITLLRLFVELLDNDGLVISQNRTHIGILHFIVQPHHLFSFLLTEPI